MGWREVNRVIRLQIKQPKKAVLTAAAAIARAGGEGIFIGTKRWAGDAGATKPTLIKFRREFVAEGVLIVVKESRGGRGRPTEYRLDLARAEEIYAAHPYAGPADYYEEQPSNADYAYRAGGDIKGSESRTVLGDGNGKAQHRNGKNYPPKQGEKSYPRDRDILENTRVRDGTAASPPDGGGGAAIERLGQPVDQYWKIAEPQIIAKIGRSEFAAFFGLAVCLADDGKCMTLSLPTKQLAEGACKHVATIKNILEREIEIVALTHQQRAEWHEQRRLEYAAAN